MVFEPRFSIEESAMKVLILAGGGGTRLWPLSTEDHPKQFITLPGMDQSLFQITLKRALGFCDPTDIVVVTSEKYKQLVFDQAEELDITLKENQVFLETKRLNTLPAIFAGLRFVDAQDHEDVLVLPSDHIIENELSLQSAVQSAESFLENHIAVFGVVPMYAHTGYGYIKPNSSNKSDVREVLEFKEKPDVATATNYVDQGYLWNAGIFYFRYGYFKKLLQEHQSPMYDHFMNTTDVYRAFNEWSHGTSVDYGLLEKTKNIVVASISSGWTDIGSFDSLIDYLQIQSPQLQQISGDGSILITEDSIQTVTIGVNDLIIVQTKKGHLICKRGQSQLVKDIK
jgi:mannose-1-phosphate guanylyltransferase / mannose-6-phosphate isomerase